MTRILAPPTPNCWVGIKDDLIELTGVLTIPDSAQGIIVLTHGSGSHRYSRLNPHIAQRMNQTALATLLLNLLTPDEEAADMRSQHYRFDIQLLALRLSKATEWLLQSPQTSGLKIGYFNANTESAAALVAAANHPDRVDAIVSRSGRVDLAGSALLRVKTPTLLIVGSGDMPCLGMSQDALTQLHGPKCLEIIPNATHLFEEQGTLEQAIRLAIHWFHRYLIKHPSL